MIRVRVTLYISHISVKKKKKLFTWTNAGGGDLILFTVVVTVPDCVRASVNEKDLCLPPHVFVKHLIRDNDSSDNNVTMIMESIEKYIRFIEKFVKHTTYNIQIQT